MPPKRGCGLGRASLGILGKLKKDCDLQFSNRPAAGRNDRPEAFFLLKAKDVPSKICVFFYSVLVVFSPPKEQPIHQTLKETK